MIERQQYMPVSQAEEDSEEELIAGSASDEDEGACSLERVREVMKSRRWRAGLFFAAALVLLALVGSVLILASTGSRSGSHLDRSPDAVVLRPVLPMVCGAMNCSIGSVCCGSQELNRSICCGWNATCCPGIEEGSGVCCGPNSKCCNGICCLPDAICCNGMCGGNGSVCTGTIILAPPLPTHAPPHAKSAGTLLN